MKGNAKASGHLGYLHDCCSRCGSEGVWGDGCGLCTPPYPDPSLVHALYLSATAPGTRGLCGVLMCSCSPMGGESGHWAAAFSLPEYFVARVGQGTRHWARLQRRIFSI